MKTQICCRCHKEKAIDAFQHRLVHGKSDINSWCKDCMKDYLHTYQRTHAEQIREQKHAYYLEHRVLRGTWGTQLDTELTPEQIELVVGSVLGDGRLSRQGNRTNAYFTSSGTNKSYMEWKYRMVANLCQSPLLAVHRAPPRKTRYDVFTVVNRTLTKLHHLMYRPKKAPCPEILKWLSPLALAVWFMDDGSLIPTHGKRDKFRYYLNTQCFTLAQNEMLRLFLNDRYALLPRLYADRRRDRVHYFLGLGKDDTLKFREIVRPYIVPSMYYKLGC